MAFLGSESVRIKYSHYFSSVIGCQLPGQVKNFARLGCDANCLNKVNKFSHAMDSYNW